MGHLHEAVTWYKICPAGWQATQWDIQNKEKSRLASGNRFVLEAVAFFCHPAWRILYRATVSCKEPIRSSSIAVSLKFNGDEISITNSLTNQKALVNYLFMKPSHWQNVCETCKQPSRIHVS